MFVGVQTPSYARGNASEDRESEPFGDEAFTFTRIAALQRDVSVEIEAVDRMGSFMGSLFVDGRNFSVELLSLGYGRIFAPAADKNRYCDLLYAAEEEAKEKKLGVCLSVLDFSILHFFLVPSPWALSW